MSFLGRCLILLRCFINDNKKIISTPITLVGVEILILLPKCLYYVFIILKTNINEIP